MLSPQDGQPVVVWFQEELSNFGPALAALAALAAWSGRIRSAVGRAHLGPTAPQAILSPGLVWSALLLPVGFWLLSVWVSRAFEAFFMHATIEDGWMENGQAVLLCAASAASGLAARALWRRHRRLWSCAYLALALGLFWVGGEEISWGQRIFHLPTPAWFASHNTQEELNLHNLAGVDDTMSSLADRALSCAVWLSAALWVTGLRRLRRLHTALWLPHPSLIPGLCCVVSYGEILRLYELLRGGPQGIPAGILQLQEARETVLYAVALMFLLMLLHHLRGTRTGGD